ncbi:7 transmembrane receptor [Ancylostoma duodenale]|uniref:7 transmembrane receptor n=2 Tax=Ancylostoma duodenale TaxID=51022 RepID=A0A0C2C9B6_9BILA|nr:7 transmembrane receptor [Ancylostoma duodenale]
MDNSTAPLSSAPMRHETSDYVQMALFLLFMAVGLPVNISTLIYMLRRYRHAKSFLLLLHINLNISDILVLGVYVPGLIGWLITLEWKGGALMCKVMRFVDVFVLAISSNIMVCIALYRLYALRYPLWISAVGHSRVPRMLLAAWGTAVVSILPQLYVWREVDFGNFRQCVAIWTEKINLGGNRTLMTDMDFQLMKLYGIQNAIITFYIPLDIYKTLNASEPEMSSALYLSELSKLSTFNKRWSKKEKESTVSLTTRTIRGQDKLRRAKEDTRQQLHALFRWMVISFESYRDHQDTTFPLAFLVVLNSVINPFIYGRCQGLRLMFSCNQMEKRPKKVCRILHC